METRINPSRLKNTFQMLDFDGITFASNRDLAGGIAIGWKNTTFRVIICPTSLDALKVI